MYGAAMAWQRRLRLLMRSEWGQNPRLFLDGYRFARTSIHPSSGGDEPAPGPLETYFDEYQEGPGIWKWRHYFSAYERHLCKFVGKAPVVVEIGVHSGGSLRMWREYFGAGARIVGVDLEACKAYENKDTTIVVGDQADPEVLRQVAAISPDGIDVVIDDGGHRPHQQIATLEGLLPHLRQGGVYIVEDVHGRDNSFNAYIDGLARHLYSFGERPTASRPQPSKVRSSV
jgi:23S rRNA U2552 (ribose-2'-O)-methylase RlmE/FtsJ